MQRALSYTYLYYGAVSVEIIIIIEKKTVRVRSIMSRLNPFNPFIIK